MNYEDNKCQMSEGPDDPCRREATQTFREPYTPAGFNVRVCDEHAGHCRMFGYRSVLVFPVEAPRLNSLREVQSQRDEADFPDAALGGNDMQDDWNTIYREGCIANDAERLVRALWVDAEPDSEAETFLQSVSDYLSDRFNVAMEFCNVVNVPPVLTNDSDEFDDIPF